MAKPVQKVHKFGYALFIKRSAEDARYERVGFLFKTSLEASQYRERRHPEISKWSVQSVRVNVQPPGNEQ